MNSTPEIEIHRSPCTVSSGRVTGRTGSPPAVPRGIRAESSCQSGIASDTGVPAAASAETPVIAADAGTVDQEDALTHVREHHVRVRAGLDLVMQSGVVEGERDHPGDRAAPGEIGAFVRSGAFAGHERERPERPPPA